MVQPVSRHIISLEFAHIASKARNHTVALGEPLPTAPVGSVFNAISGVATRALSVPCCITVLLARNNSQEHRQRKEVKGGGSSNCTVPLAP